MIEVLMVGAAIAVAFIVGAIVGFLVGCWGSRLYYEGNGGGP
ncbi:MAG: hypothetical protein WC683_05070 [bacterium]